ncbi:MAG: hypothetical protein ABFC24_04015, partial [Methanoregulaceae archaeon]
MANESKEICVRKCPICSNEDASKFHIFDIEPIRADTGSARESNQRSTTRTLVLQCPAHPPEIKDNAEKRFLVPIDLSDPKFGWDTTVVDVKVKHHIGESDILKMAGPPGQCPKGKIPVDAFPLYKQDDCILDNGCTLIKESVSAGVDFHKTMIPITATFTTAMATIFLYLSFGTTSGHTMTLAERFLMGLPVFAMLASSICFIWGYYPEKETLNPGVIESVEEARNRMIDRRYCWAKWGVLCF